MAVTIEINLRRRVVRLPAAAGELFELVAGAISEVHPDWWTVDIRIRNRACEVMMGQATTPQAGFAKIGTGWSQVASARAWHVQPALALVSLLSLIVMDRAVSNNGPRCPVRTYARAVAGTRRRAWAMPACRDKRCPLPPMEDGTGICHGAVRSLWDPPSEAQRAPACDWG